MKISLFRGGFATLYSSETIETWDEFVDLVARPVIGIKNGDYFVRGFCDGPRCDASITHPEMIIIDGDQLENDGSSCCPPQPVHAAMVTAGITHVIYTSYSNDVINSRHKWRLCIPCNDLTDAGDLHQGVNEIIGYLHRSGLRVRNVVENMTLSQPWFTPRVPAVSVDDFYAKWHDGEIYQLGKFPQNGVEVTEKPPASSALGQFSWDYVFDQFQSGTIHQGIKAASGWLVRTTDWADSQIIEHITSLVDRLCPDSVKVKRAKDGEIKKLVEFCRKKSGTIFIENDTTWKSCVITAEQLRDKDFPPIRWAVDGLIPEGLTVIAGDPKSGKSLLAVDICSAIASGAECLGNMSCVEGGSIYISMEDPERRVKERIQQQCNLWPEKFVLVTGGINPALESFSKTVDEMLMLYPATRAIIVDTMNFIIPEKPQSISDYNHYYSVLTPLQKWAITNHIALIMITHKSKATPGSGDNPFSGILGSVAIQGCADCMIMLSKNHDKEKNDKTNEALPDGFLTITGRDMGSHRYNLEFDSEAMKWAAVNKNEKVSKNTNWLQITQSIKTKMLGPKEISKETKINNSTVKSCLGRMLKQEIVISKDGKYGLPGVDYEEVASRW